MIERTRTEREMLIDYQHRNVLGFVFVLIMVPLLGLLAWGLILLGIFVYSLGFLAWVVACVIVVGVFLALLFFILMEI